MIATMIDRIASFTNAWRSIMVGMGLTFKRAGMPEVTVRYPFEVPVIAEQFRGAPRLKDILDGPFDATMPPHEPGEFNAAVNRLQEAGDLPACISACPAHVDVRGYVELVAGGRFKDALDVIRERCSLPASIGRVCTRSCEEGCQRNFFDEPLSIRDIKRFAADACMDLPHPDPVSKTNGKKVAVIGAGPAGLTAAQALAKEGYHITIYDKNPQGGGTLLTGIPKYRLPKDVLKWDVDAICALGVELKTNVDVGTDIALSSIIDSHDAVLIAAGLQSGWMLDIKGEDAEGVWGCLDLLREANFDNNPEIGTRVVVVGGGNVAMDGARTALRLGAEQVYLVYRRSMSEMPARSEEIYEAIEEGVIFELLTNPVRVMVEDGRVAGLECVKMGLGEPDASGRRRPEPIPGSEYILDIDTVIVAIGQRADLGFLNGSDIERDKKGAIVFNKLTLQTSNPKVFVAGEVVTGAGAAIEAIASGHEAAESLDRFLRGVDLSSGRTPQVLPSHYAYPKAFMGWVGADRRRKHMSMLSVENRLNGFVEVELGFTREEAIMEANRCLLCNTGACSGCAMCARTCPAFCINVERTDSLEAERKVIWYDLDLTKCMFCGLCAEICPTGALEMSKNYENAELARDKLIYKRSLSDRLSVNK